MPRLSDAELASLAETLSPEEYDRLIEESELECNQPVDKVNRCIAEIVDIDRKRASPLWQFTTPADRKKINRRRYNLVRMVRYATDPEYHAAYLAKSREYGKRWYQKHHGEDKLRYNHERYLRYRDKFLARQKTYRKKSVTEPKPEKENCQCAYCGQPMYRPPCRLKASHQFCNRTCQGKYHNQQMKGRSICTTD